ncbi:MAG: BatA domain-containing protein [Luteolibacter sp.]
MTFGFPAFFWAALALVPLAAVYFIRTKPRRQEVNAFFLWEQVFKQKAASSLFQRMRNFLSLLIVALAFLAAVFALTKPRFDDGETPDLLIIIDRSASMQTVEDGKSHLEMAKEMAGSWIAALGASQRAAVASVADGLVYHENLSNQVRGLRDALDEIEASDVALDGDALGELSLLSTAAGDDKGKTRILFLTDGHSAALKVPEGVEVISIGKAGENMGITAADLRWDGPGRATVFLSLVSSFPEEKEVELELVAKEDGLLVQLFTVKAVPGEVVSESIPLENINPGAYLLRLRAEDALAIDNVAPLGLNAPQAIPVQVKAKNPFFFNQVISAFSRADSLFEVIEGYSRLSLAEGVPPEAEVAVVFAPSGECPFWSDLGGELEPGPAEIVAKDHPLLERADVSLLNFPGARKLTAPDGAVVVLEHTDGTPLLYTTSVDGRAAVVFNFDPSLEDFFLSPWFPVFVHDAAVLLTGRENGFPSVVSTGRVVEVPGTGETDKVSFEGEELEAKSPVMVDKVGNYGFRRSSTNWNLGGAVLSAGESSGVPEGEEPSEVKLASGWPLAAWLVLAAVVALIVEEGLYHRRKVG